MKKGMKLLSLMLALSLLFALAACGTTGTGDEPSTEAAQSSSPVAQDVTLNVAALKGPTGIGMVKLMKDAKDGATANTTSPLQVRQMKSQQNSQAVSLILQPFL